MLCVPKIMTWNSEWHIQPDLQMREESIYWPRNYVMGDWNQYPKPVQRGTAINAELEKLATKNSLRHYMNLSWKTTNQGAFNDASDQSGKSQEGFSNSNVTICDDVTTLLAHPLDNCCQRMFILEDLVHALKIDGKDTSLVWCNSLDNCCFGIISLLIAPTGFFYQKNCKPMRYVYVDNHHNFDFKHENFVILNLKRISSVNSFPSNKRLLIISFILYL